MYFVVLVTTKYTSLEEAKAKAPEDIAAHVAHSREAHERGDLVMAGAFLDHPEEPVSTMAVLTSRRAAEEYVQGDPFVRKQMVSGWEIREWANLLP